MERLFTYRGGNMNNRKVHKMTIQKTFNQNTPVSSLLLKGKWLAEFGYTPETKVTVTEEPDGSIVIRKQENNE